MSGLAAPSAVVVRLADLVDAMARTTGGWLLVEELGRVVCHGVGVGKCGSALAQALVTKDTQPLRNAVTWQRGSTPLSGTVDGQPVTAFPLGEGGTAWFFGAHPAPDAVPELAAALHAQEALPHDPMVHDLLHLRGPARAGSAPLARLVALSAESPLPALCRAVAAASVGRSVRSHVDDNHLLLALEPTAAVAELVAEVATRCPGTAAGTVLTPNNAHDWRTSADLAASALAAARLLGLQIGDVDEPTVAAELLVREAINSVSLLERQLHTTPLKSLLTYDERTSSDLVPTLRAWCLAGFDSKVAAARLHVHVNTLRYRLKRAAKVSGLQFDNPRQRLSLQLMLLS